MVPTLAAFEPFTSFDADIFGSRALAETLAARAGWECRILPKRDSASVAILLKSNAVGEPPLVIEVLDEVNGLTETDLALSTVVELEGGQRYRLPSPLVLFKAKLYNLISLANLDRPQDLRHTRMLMALIPHYLNDLLSAVRRAEVPERELLGAVRYLRDVIRQPWAGNALRSHGLDHRALFSEELRRRSPLMVRAAIEDIAP